MYSYQIEKAIQAACVLHHSQARKGNTPVPYVSHVFSVFLIVSDYADKEDTLIAALLHDTLEDTKYTEEELEEDFGSNVRRLVLAVSEDKKITDWRERKTTYVQSVKNGGEAALIISAADKIHNMRSMIDQYHNDIPGYRKNFERYRTHGLTFLTQLHELLEASLESKIVDEFSHVLNEFRNFNDHVTQETK